MFLSRQNFLKRRYSKFSYRPCIAFPKRLFDVIVSLILIFFLLPLFLAILLAQVASTPGAPVFFWQPRVGKDGKIFFCLKFRTMCVNADGVLRALLSNDAVARAEWEASQKLKNDPRVSGMGHVLRATSLDEIPQLWNVLRGEMSLVGPRPVTEGEMQRWYETLGGSTAYKAVRPGITGLWQVSGRSSTTYEHRVKLDCQYVRDISALNDLRILCRTIGAVLCRDGAY